MRLVEAIEILEQAVTEPSLGLVEKVFIYISTVTPLVNVDLFDQG